MSRWRPVAPDALSDCVADWLACSPGIVRVAVDGPPCAHPDAFAAGLVDALRTRGRPAAQVFAETFWRDASVRLEQGHQDIESYLSWLDADALRREVLEPTLALPARYLPSLRDPRTNRSTRAAPVDAAPELVLLVSGSLLLRHGLAFDRTIHLALSPAARERRTPADRAWTLPAYQAYDAEVKPAEVADLVIKLDDPRHPALRSN